MKSSFSKSVLRSVVALGCCVGSALGVGANTLVNAESDVILENVPEHFKKMGIETLFDLYSYVSCVAANCDARQIKDGDYEFYVDALKDLFPYDGTSFYAAKKTIPNFKSFIFALGKIMNQYTWAYYADEKKSENSEKMTWIYQRGKGLANGFFCRWDYPIVKNLTKLLIRVYLKEYKVIK